jgi:chromate transporter
VNAAVVGVLLAALFYPLWTSTVHSVGDFVVALVAFVLLTQWRVQPIVVVGGAVALSVAGVVF